MDLHMQGKKVVVAGGSTGIGLAAALEFARENAEVLICSRSSEKLTIAADRFAKEGLSAQTFAADVSKKEGVDALAATALDVLGGIDIWFNNAGTSINKRIDLFTEDELDKLIDTNFKSAYWGCAAAARYMIEHGGGVILNTTSFAVKLPLAGGGIYAATKSAVESLTKSFAAELAPYHIRVVSIIPGFIETPLTEKAVEIYRKELTSPVSAGRLGLPEDLARPIVAVASDGFDYLTGTSLEISGGKFIIQDAMTPWAWKRS